MHDAQQVSGMPPKHKMPCFGAEIMYPKYVNGIKNDITEKIHANELVCDAPLCFQYEMYPDPATGILIVSVVVMWEGPLGRDHLGELHEFYYHLLLVS